MMTIETNLAILKSSCYEEKDIISIHSDPLLTEKFTLQAAFSLKPGCLSTYQSLVELHHGTKSDVVSKCNVERIRISVHLSFYLFVWKLFEDTLCHFAFFRV